MIPAGAAPASFTVHPAIAQHAASIRNLILRSGINPSGLDWKRFVVAESVAGDFIGCGQLKPHADGSMELASIAVQLAWRGHGVARAIIETLLAKYPGVLHLMCESSNGPLYEKFGFFAIEIDEMPVYFRRVSKLVGVLQNLDKEGRRMLIMRREAQA